MKEELITQLTETDYVQVGKLEAIRIKPLRESNGYLHDVQVDILRRIPRYDFLDEEHGGVLDDIFTWTITGKWDDVLNPEKEVLMTHGFIRDANSLLGACYLRDYTGRRFSISCDPRWDFMRALNAIQHRPRYNCLYRYQNGAWEILEWREVSKNTSPGNIWRVKTGEEICDSYLQKGEWKRL